MTSELTSQVAVALLVLLLVSVLAVTIFFVVAYVRHTRASLASGQTGKESASSAREQDSPIPLFENPMRWLAIRSNNLGLVQSALGLAHVTPCSWEDGLSRLNEHSLFISPPVQGWILVMGPGLPDPAEDIDDCFQFIIRLSRGLGHVQFFSANRAVNHHAWAQVEDGRVRRGYAWAQETLWNQGAMTQAEKDLGLKCFAYGESAELLNLSASGDTHHANADKLLFLAARWSLDPTAITGRMLGKGRGVLGERIHSKRQR